MKETNEELYELYEEGSESWETKEFCEIKSKGGSRENLDHFQRRYNYVVALLAIISRIKSPVYSNDLLKLL